MTQLDEFTIDFKTKATAQTRSEIAAIDKQLDDMDKKGKKRSDVEEKDYQRLKKHRKELLEDTRQQQRETDKLSQSFQRLASDAVGAVTAWATFSGIKNGLIDVNRLNVGLANLAGQTGISAQKYRELGAAIASSTGLSPDVGYALLSGYAGQRKAANQPVTDQGAAAYVQTLRNTLKNYQKGQGPAGILGIPGVNEALPFLQQSEEGYQKALEFGKSVSVSQADSDAALKNQEAAAKALLEVQKVGTEQNTYFSHAVEMFNSAVQTFVGAFSGHPIATTVGETALTAGKYAAGGLISGAILKRIFGAAGTIEATPGIPLWIKALVGVGIAGGAAYLYHESSSSDSSQTSLPPSAQQKVMNFWQSRGYSQAAAAGWAANAQAESGFNPAANNGSHGGIYQWSQARRAKILKKTGIDVWNSSLDKQLEAAAWEANQMGLSPGALSGNSGASAALISNRFEVPSTTSAGLAAEAAKRANIAQSYNIPSSSSINGAGGSSKIFNIKIDDVTIQTAATDAAGIAGAVSVELKNQIRMAMSNFDDGVNA